MSDILEITRYTQHKGDTVRYDFNFTGKTPFIGYTSTSIFKTVAKTRVTAKAEAEEKKLSP